MWSHAGPLAPKPTGGLRRMASGQTHQPRAAGRRRAWGLHLGRARPAAGSDEIEIAGISGTSAGALNGAAVKAGWRGAARSRGAREPRLALGTGGRDHRSAHHAMARGGGAGRRQQRDRGLPALRRRRQRLAHGQPLRRRAVLPQSAAGGSWKGSITTRSAAILGPPSTSAPPMCEPARSASSPATISGPRRSWPRPVCRRCSRRWRSPMATGRMEAYWDGGYTGNPALYPLFAPELPGDIVVVNINPLVPRRGAGDRARDPEPDQRDQLQRLASAGIARHRLRAAPAGGRHVQEGG
jgi:hypothetical protein